MRVLQNVIVKNRIIQRDTILMLAGGIENQFFVVHVIFENDFGNVYVIAKEIGKYVHYVEHYQAYGIHENVSYDNDSWKCFNETEIQQFYVSRIVTIHVGRRFIPKRWI